MGPSKAGGGQSIFWGMNRNVPILDASALSASRLSTSKLAIERPIIISEVVMPGAFSARDAVGFSMNKNRIEAPILAARPMLSARSRAQSSLGQPGKARPALQDASALASLKTVVDWPGAGTLHGQIARKQRGLAVTKQQMNDVGARIVDPFEDLNTRVFSEVFLTPRSDPWLGMLTEDMWTGIKDDGVVKTGN
jgi:hypothetical protein